MHGTRRVEIYSQTDLGCQRENNEDSYGSWQPSPGAESAQKGVLLVVADGMGGYEGGQEASRLAVETVKETYSGSLAEDPQTLLFKGLREAHARIVKYAAAHPGLRGMGTTCTAVAVVGKNLYFAHVGDSRLYRVRDGEISRLTRDHSYVGRLVESGAISPEEAETHVQRHILTAALGAGEEVYPDVPEQPLTVEENDVLLLCTDGLWGLINDGEIATTVSRNSPAEAVRQLVQLARERGGPDNITVLMLLA
jgi:protein phosphatase